MNLRNAYFGDIRPEVEGANGASYIGTLTGLGIDVFEYQEYYDYVDKEKIKNLLINQRFEEQFLITTSCFDAGINIIDTDVKHIVIDIVDIGSLIQCIGRKRIQSEDDKVHIYIKIIIIKLKINIFI